MQRRMVDTALRNDGPRWEDLAARALTAPARYRPVPGAAVYHVSVNDQVVQVGEYDLDGPLRDLVTVVLAMGEKVLARHPTPVTPRCPLPTRIALSYLTL